MRKASLAFGVLGVVGVALGALWLLQGLGVVHLRPILCFADCAPLQEASPTWAVIGACMLVAGAVAIFMAARRRPPSP